MFFVGVFVYFGQMFFVEEVKKTAVRVQNLNSGYILLQYFVYQLCYAISSTLIAIGKQ